MPAEQEKQPKADVERQNWDRGCHALQFTLDAMSPSRLFRFGQAGSGKLTFVTVNGSVSTVAFLALSATLRHSTD